MSVALTYVKVAEFPAFLTNFKQGQFGTWRVELGVEATEKDRAWPLTDWDGQDLFVVVLARRYTGEGEEPLSVGEVVDSLMPASEDVPPLRRSALQVIADAEARVEG